MKRFRGGLVFKAHRPFYHSTLGLRVINREIVWSGDDEDRYRAKMEQLKGLTFLLESQDQILVLAVPFVPNALDSGYFIERCAKSFAAEILEFW